MQIYVPWNCVLVHERCHRLVQSGHKGRTVCLEDIKKYYNHTVITEWLEAISEALPIASQRLNWMNEYGIYPYNPTATSLLMTDESKEVRKVLFIGENSVSDAIRCKLPAVELSKMQYADVSYNVLPWHEDPPPPIAGLDAVVFSRPHHDTLLIPC
jgi:hypothetical protein